jgi:hypothetical protein
MMRLGLVLLAGCYVGVEGACSDVECTEVCAPPEGASGVDCATGYVAGA